MRLRSLRRAAGSRGVVSLGWSFADVIGSKVIVLATFLILARYLPPADFGVVALASTLIGSAIAALDSGYGGALIQRRRAGRDDFSTGFVLAGGLGLAMGLLLALGGAVSGWALGSEAVAWSFVGLAPVLLLHCVSIPHQSYLLRRGRMGVLARGRLWSVVVGSVCAVAWAVWRPDYRVLIVQQLATMLVFVGIVWTTSGWRPRLRFDRAVAADINRFSKYFWGWGLLVSVEKNADLWAIGASLGTAAVGIHSNTIRLAGIVYELTTAPAIRLILPAYARLQDAAPRLRRHILAVTTLLTGATTPVFVGLALVAPELVAVMLGPEWVQVGVLLPFFAIAGLMQAATMHDNQVTTALNRPDLVMRQTAVGLALLGAAVAAGLPFGLEGLALGMALRAVAVRLIAARMMAGLAAVPFGAWARCHLPATAAALAMTAAVLLAGVKGIIPADPVAAIAAKGLIGAAVYLPTVMLVFRDDLGRAWRTLAEAGRSAVPGPTRVEVPAGGG